MNKLISIIIPVFNSEKYLRKCLDSILNQTYKKLEIILIDDGSTDSSPEICEEYSKKSKSIVVHHKKNEGVSIARNFGIEHSTGEYLLFIDSDDYIGKDYVMTLYNNIKKTDADISMSNIIRVDENNNIIDEFDIKRKNVKIKTIEMNDKEFISNILDYSGYFTYATNKLIKKAIIKDVRFRNDIHYNEDGIFFLDLSSNIKKAVYIYPVYMYYYVQNNNSANAQKFNGRHLTILKSFKIMEKYFDIFNNKCKCYYSYRYISYYVESIYYLKVNHKLEKNTIKEYKKVRKKYFKYAIKNDDISLFKKIKFIIKAFFPFASMKYKYKNKKRGD